MSFPTIATAGAQVTATDFNDFTLNPTYTYGETITAGQALYQKAADGKVYKASAGTLAHVESFVGIAIESGVANDTKRILGPGKVTTGLLSGLTDGSVYYLSDTAGSISTTPGRYTLRLGVAKGTTAILLIPIRIVGTLGQFGDFSDGDLAFDGSTDVASVSSRASNVYTLTRDVFADKLTMSSNAIIDMAGYRVYARVVERAAASTAKFRFNGAAGGNGSGSSAGSVGTATPGVSVPTPAAPGAGGAGGVKSATAGHTDGSPGGAGNSLTNTLVATGTLTAGAGGSAISGSGTGAAGAAGTSATNTVTVSKPRTMVTATTLALIGGSSVTVLRPSCGGPGGGGGGGSINNIGATATGGGGGAGGYSAGVLFVAAEKIVDLGSGTMFEAIGGAGGNGANGTTTSSGDDAAGGGGAGAGGCGGVVIRLYRWLIGSATVDTSAGAAGTPGTGFKTGGGSTGNNGGTASAGVAGATYDIPV